MAISEFLLLLLRCGWGLRLCITEGTIRRLITDRIIITARPGLGFPATGKTDGLRQGGIESGFPATGNTGDK